MRHYPVFLDLRSRRIVVSGAGETALAKLRLLIKTEALIEVFGATPDPAVLRAVQRGPDCFGTTPVANRRRGRCSFILCSQ